MPTNLYGPNDSYDLLNSHVLPALINKFHNARELGLASVEIWGSGTPKREFLHVDDLAEACLFLMNEYDNKEIINVGTGVDLSIKDLAMLIKRCIGFLGDLIFDPQQPDGTPRKLLDTSKINQLGWSAKIELEDGVKEVCRQFELSISRHEATQRQSRLADLRR
jgi:GDP-L-fucose synthase